MPGTRLDRFVGDLWVVWAVVAVVSNRLRFYSSNTTLTVGLLSSILNMELESTAHNYPQLYSAPVYKAFPWVLRTG